MNDLIMQIALALQDHRRSESMILNWPMKMSKKLKKGIILAPKKMFHLDLPKLFTVGNFRFY